MQAVTEDEGLIELIEEQLEAYRQSGRALHLAHAARALQDIRKRVASGTPAAADTMSERAARRL